MAVRKKGGRPKMAEEDKAKKELSVYLTETQKAELTVKAKAVNMTLSQFVMNCAFTRTLAKPVPAINKSAYADLGNVGSNLNQIARKLNEGGQVSVSYLLPEIDALRALLIATRLDLSGEKS